MNGRVIPVSGRMFKFTPILMKACERMSVVIPVATYFQNKSCVASAMRKPRHQMMR